MKNIKVSFKNNTKSQQHKKKFHKLIKCNSIKKIKLNFKIILMMKNKMVKMMNLILN